MAFLDNSGDIILDAVLTDVGRMRLAKGDGSFQITAFALGDDEIDYSLYNANHPSGSAYYDLAIKQTPILESFTNNSSFLKSKLMSINRFDLFYLPVMKLNELINGTAKHTSGVFVVTVDNTTSTNSSLQNVTGILNGFNPGIGENYIRIDQGIDNSAQPPTIELQPALRETQYAVRIHNDLGSIYSPSGNGGQGRARASSVDDDGIATYFFSLTANNTFVTVNSDTTTTSTNQVIAGSRGSILQFKIAASENLRSSTALFTELGGSGLTVNGVTNLRYIDTFVEIEGITTGYKIEIPIRYIKA
jgi:hypothetical protein